MLIVDDQPSDAETLRRIVTEANHESPVTIDVAHSLAQAQTLYRSTGYDLAIVDVCMDGSDPTGGYQLLFELATERERVIVIAITGRVVRLEDQNPITQAHPRAMIRYKTTDTFIGDMSQLISNDPAAFDESLRQAVEEAFRLSEQSRQRHRPSGTFGDATLDGRLLRGPAGGTTELTPHEAVVLEELMRAAHAGGGVPRRRISRRGKRKGREGAMNPEKAAQVVISRLRTHHKAIGSRNDIRLNDEQYALVPPPEGPDA